MEYSYSYLYSYLLEYFFSVLSCTLYLVKFMSTCTRTYLSTVTKNPVLMSTTEYFLKFQSDRKKIIVFQALPHLFQMLLIRLFQTCKKVASSIFFRFQNQNIGIFMLKMKKKCAPLRLIKKEKKSGLICFWEIKNINKKPACLICFS